MTDQERLTELEQEVKNINSALTAHGIIVNNPVPQNKRKYGFRPDLPDQRDFNFAQLQKKVVLPASVDLRLHCSPVKDQGNLGSCTANAFASGLEFLENKDGIKPDIYMSRLFIYYNERVIEGTVNSDSGAALRDGIKALAARGCCAETEWPYIISRFETRPSAGCYTDGLKHVIQSYYRVNALNDMQTCLASGFPFIFGFTVYESFESAQVAATGIVPMPQPNEQVLGGHAVLCVGYDNSTQMFLVKNSWGTAWGIHGYMKMPFAYLTNPNLASDMWYISKAKGM